MPTFPTADPGIVQQVNRTTEELFPTAPSVSSSTLPDSLNGFEPTGRVLTPEEFQEEKIRYDDLSGVKGGALASLAAAARGLSFGTSDLALTKTGLVSPETLKQLKQINPTISTASDVGAILATTLLSGGAGLLGTGARTAGLGVEALTAAGRAAEGLVAAGLEKQAAKSLAQKIFATTVAKAAGGSVEGVGFAGGGLISDYALGDPDLNAEKVVGTLGLGALFGAGVGATAGALKSVGPSLLEKASASADRLQTNLKAVENPVINGVIEGVSKASSILSHEKSEVISGALQSALKETPENPVSLLTKTGKNELAKQIISDTGDVIDAYQVGQKALYQAHSKAMESLAADAGGAFDETAAKKGSELVSDMMSTARKLEKINPTLASDLNDLSEKAAGTVTEKKTLAGIHNGLNDTKRELGELAEFGTRLEELPLTERRGLQELQRLYGRVRSGLEDSESFGPLGAEQESFNKSLSQTISDFNNFRARFLAKEVQPNGSIKWAVNDRKMAMFLNNIDAASKVKSAEYFQNGLSSMQKFLKQADVLGEGPEAVQSFIRNHPVLSKLDENFFSKIDPLQKKLAQEQAAFRLKELSHGIEGQTVNVGDVLAMGGLFHVLGPVGPLAYGAFHLLKHPANLARGLGSIAANIKRLDGATNEALSSFLQKGSAAATSKVLIPSSVKALQASGFMDVEGAPKKRSESKVQAFERASKGLSDLQTNPAKLTQTISENLKPLSKAAPNIANSASAVALRAVQFLQSKMPKNTNTSMLGNKPWRPSDKELAQFERYLKASEDPVSVLKDLKAGVVTREGVEALKTIYPKYYQELQGQIFSKVSELQKELPYQDRLQLSIFFGVPVEKAMSPDFIRAMQANYQSPGAGASPDQQGLRMSGLQKLNLGESRTSASEKIEGR